MKFPGHALRLAAGEGRDAVGLLPVRDDDALLVADAEVHLLVWETRRGHNHARILSKPLSEQHKSAIDRSNLIRKRHQGWTMLSSKGEFPRTEGSPTIS